MNIEQVRFNMIEQQIRTWEVLDTDVLDLLHVLKREAFVPESLKNFALMDIECPLTPVSATEKMWPPRVEARVLQALGLSGQETVLEVGTGSGYMTALLAARAKHVTTVEIDAALAAFGASNLSKAGVKNVTTVVGDGAKGWGASSKYDVIVFTGSMEVIPDAAITQLNDGGRVFAIVGKAPVMRAQLLRRVGESVASSTLFETVVAPLINAAKAPAFNF